MVDSSLWGSQLMLRAAISYLSDFKLGHYMKIPPCDQSPPLRATWSLTAPQTNAILGAGRGWGVRRRRACH
jgi:hypothetical protein